MPGVFREIRYGEGHGEFPGNDRSSLVDRNPKIRDRILVQGKRALEGRSANANQTMRPFWMMYPAHLNMVREEEQVLEQLKEQVYEANMMLPKYGLVTFTWGNVSAIDREDGLVVIKPSGIDYDKLRPEDMAVVDLEGNQIEEDIIRRPIRRRM